MDMEDQAMQKHHYASLVITYAHWFPQPGKRGSEFLELQQTEVNCHSSLPLELAPVHLNHFYILHIEMYGSAA